MPFHVRILAGLLGRGTGSHLYHTELARRLAARGHRVSIVCFDSVPEVEDAVEVVKIPRRTSEPWPFVWRFASLADYSRCSRGLMRQDLPPADVVIGGEHLFLRAHARKFPEVPWLYLPHSLLIHQEIASYGLLPVQHWVMTRLYSSLQRWALDNADRTL